MLLYAIKHYAPGDHRSIKVEPAEALPVVGIYHPDAPNLFETFDSYQKWYQRKLRRALDPSNTIGLLLMRPQIVSDARQHYDGLIRAIEDEGLSVIPAISTFMDNRDACRKFFVEEPGERKGIRRSRREDNKRDPVATLMISLRRLRKLACGGRAPQGDGESELFLASAGMNCSGMPEQAGERNWRRSVTIVPSRDSAGTTCRDARRH